MFNVLFNYSYCINKFSKTEQLKFYYRSLELKIRNLSCLINIIIL